MLRKSAYVLTMFVVAVLLLSACSLFKRQSAETPTPMPTAAIQAPTETLVPTLANPPTPTTPPTLCENPYQPTKQGDTWVYKGNNTSTGDYTRTDTVSKSSADAFTIETEIAGISSAVDYTCTSAGLVVVNPVEQYIGTLLAIPNSQVKVDLLSSAGVSLPTTIKPGDSWEQTADWDATAKDISTNGRAVFDYKAVGIEGVTVPFGTFDALRIQTTISVSVTALRIPIGTYELTTWLVPNIGVVKSQGVSHIRNVTFSDSSELMQYTPAP